MAFPTRAHYVVLAAALLLVVGVGGGAGYAAGLVTSADIQDETIRSVDVHDQGLKLRDFSATAKEGLIGPPGEQGQTGPSDAYAMTSDADVILTTSPSTVASLSIPQGQYVAIATGSGYSTSAGSTAVTCWLVNGPSISVQSVVALTNAYRGGVTTQMAFSTPAGTTSLEFRCLGTNGPGINQVAISAIKVGTVH